MKFDIIWKLKMFLRQYLFIYQIFFGMFLLLEILLQIQMIASNCFSHMGYTSSGVSITFDSRKNEQVISKAWIKYYI